MKEISHPKGKIYYSMGEVCEMFDVNASLIRFWESKFDLLSPQKNKKGNRVFTPQDVDNLNLVYHLVKERGMTLSGAAMRIRQNREGLRHDLELIDRLQKIRAMLVEIREELRETPNGYVAIDVSADDESGADEADPSVRDPEDVRDGQENRPRIVEQTLF